MFNRITVLQLITILLATSLTNYIKCEDEDSAEFVKSTHDFTIELLKAASENETNTVISPFSISMILSILQQGARGNTEAELSHVLGVDANLTKAGYRNFTRTMLERESQGVIMEWGNKVYTKDGISINPEFKNEIEENFQSQFETLDFSGGDSQALSELINSWINQTTHGEISDIIQPDMVGIDTLMMLVNVIYFKGNWLRPFRTKNTKTENFEPFPKEFIPTPFMHQKGVFETGRNTTLGIKWIELIYQDRNYGIIFVLPLKRHGLKEVLNRLTGEDFRHMAESGMPAEVRLRLPKFKLKGKYDLTQLLPKLGLNELFLASCNLIGAIPEPIHVSDAIHQANFEIDETGTTASGATVFTQSRMLLMKETFRLDQPFLFFLMDRRNQIPLFSGKIGNPGES